MLFDYENKILFKVKCQFNNLKKKIFTKSASPFHCLFTIFSYIIKFLTFFCQCTSHNICYLCKIMCVCVCACVLAYSVSKYHQITSGHPSVCKYHYIQVTSYHLSVCKCKTLPVGTLQCFCRIRLPLITYQCINDTYRVTSGHPLLCTSQKVTYMLASECKQVLLGL